MKKGGYDLGRKALYYVVALMIITFVFVYITNALYKYQQQGFKNLETMEGVSAINKINSCFYYEDKDIQRSYSNTIDMEKFKQENLEKCADRPMIIKLSRFGKEKVVTSLISITKKAEEQPITLSYKEENLKEKQTIRRLVTIINQGKEEEGLLQVEIPKNG